MSGNFISAHQYALGSRDATIKIGLMNDSSTVVERPELGSDFEYCKQLDINSVLPDTGVRLMAINCEGGEYDILPALIKSGNIKKIDFLQVQFHTFVPNYESQYNDINDALIQTHDRVYHWPFVWDIWQRKGI